LPAKQVLTKLAGLDLSHPLIQENWVEKQQKPKKKAVKLPSFRPSICQVSKKIDRQSALSGVRREEQLLAKGKLYKTRKEIAIRHSQKENSMCTFKPKTSRSPLSRSLLWELKGTELDLMTQSFNSQASQVRTRTFIANKTQELI
jgi:hypothetical protein